MNLRIRFTAFIVVLGVMLTACQISMYNGSGKVRKETRKVNDFTAISLEGTGNLIITQGEIEELTIEAEDNILPQIQTEVQNDTLVITFKHQGRQDIIRPTQPINYFLTVKELTSINLGGSGNIQSEDLVANRLKVEVSGSGNTKMNRLEANELNFVLSGSGNAEFAGMAARQVVLISGSGEYRAGELDARQVEVTISGSGNATLWAEDSLNITVSGSGNISYYGNPNLTQIISGSGTVKTLGEK